MSLLHSFVALIPILSLLFLSLWKGVKTGIYVSTIITTALFFFWGGEWQSFIASVFSALLGTINILMIIFGAVFLYHVMEQKKFIAGIQESLTETHPDNLFRFYFLTFFLTGFFESVAGFGTPGAIVPLLLISMGFSPVLSVSVVLLFDGLLSFAGAVGTPVTAGLAIPLGLSDELIKLVYTNSGMLISVAGMVLLYFIYRMTTAEHAGGKWWWLYVVIMLPVAVFSGFLQELTGLIASVFLAFFGYAFLFTHKKITIRPWFPYWLLVIVLLLPKIFPFFSEWLSYKVEFTSIYGTDINAALQPFRSPLIPFLVAAFFALFLANDYTVDLKPVISKTIAVFLILFPSLGLTQLMLNSGGEQTSMIDALSSLFSESGNAFPLISPFVGIVGTFISGSTTVSNVIFGGVQYSSSMTLGMSEEIILSLQLCGASLGNAICFFNIIAAGAVAGLTDYKEVLLKNLYPVLGAAGICSLLGYLCVHY